MLSDTKVAYQPDLPFTDDSENEWHESIEMPEELKSALPNGFYWVPGNGIIPGQPFVIWTRPHRPTDHRDVMANIEKLFETYRNVQKHWPWCTFNYYSDPKTGSSAIVGFTFKSPEEMVVTTIVPSLTNSIDHFLRGLRVRW